MGGNWPDFLLAVVTSLCSLFLVSLGIIGYLRKEIPVVERALLITVASAMVLFPIGWSISGLAPAVIGGLMVVHQLWVTHAPVGGNKVQV